MKGLFLMDKISQVLRIIPESIWEEMKNSGININDVQEIRIRVNQRVIIKCTKIEKILNIVADEKCIARIIELSSNYSLYAYEKEFKNGFITIQGGHRIGIGGHAIEENGHIKNFSAITYLCIRIAHEIIGCSDKVMDFIRNGGIKHTLLVSPPGCGKTTLLRDIIRNISDNEKYNVCLIDERQEIASCYRGVPQNNIGMRTDVLDCCNKRDGLAIAVRSMSPDIIAVDEIGGMEDVEAIKYCIACGAVIIGTIHGTSVDDVKNKAHFKDLISRNYFSKIIVLSKRAGRGTIEECLSC